MRKAKPVALAAAGTMSAVRVCTKEFLYTGKDEIDDSYLATAVLAQANGPIVRVGFSLHDGNSCVAFKHDIRRVAGKPKLSSDDLKKFDGLVGRVVGRLTALQAAVRKAAEQ